MNFIIGAVLLCSAVATHAAPRVVGGQNAPDGKYPYQVSLRTSSHFCGGSILNSRWVLTAAHCVVGRSGLVVVAGTNRLNASSDIQLFNSDYIVWHENYNRVLHINDIGLIRIDGEFEFNEKVQPISISTEDFTKVDYPAVLTGWGRTQAGGAIPNNLQEIDLKIISQTKCNNQFPGVAITESHICTLTMAGEGACNGDSGGPLVADGVQVGIVSFGMPCARGIPDVFTRVYTFASWINEKMARF